ncbi:MAG: virulence factor [Anaerolineae bacterium]|nr:virulence factor [Anaerolineae bacterium]
MTTYQVLYWHDIPIQVRAGGRRDRVSRELPPRFQAAIDSAAMAAGLTGTDAYLDGFAWSEPHERDGSPQEVVAAVLVELDKQYETIDWRGTAVTIQQNPPI